MKVLSIGSTGNVGLRVIPALLTHGHKVTAYVRSAKKLESLLPASTFQQISVIEGNATDSAAISRAILDSGADAVVNSAGQAAVAPWASSDLPEIFKAVLEGVVEAGKERKKPLRAWFLGGMGILHYPETETMLSDYIPIFLAHRTNIKLLRSQAPNSLDWSVLCPSNMHPESTDFTVPTKASEHGKLITATGVLPNFNRSWIEHIPLIGRILNTGMNASRYDTTLEQNAELIASDLEDIESKFSGSTVGIIQAGK